MSDVILSGCAIIENGKLLLLYKYKDSYYEFPGGKVEEDETINEAAIRETMEEISCSVKLLKHITTTEFEKNGNKYIGHIFYASIENGEPYVDGLEHSEILWMQIEDYEKYSLAPNVSDFCKRYLNKEFNV